jgi:hypothetical protein
MMKRSGIAFLWYWIRECSSQCNFFFWARNKTKEWSNAAWMGESIESLLNPKPNTSDNRDQRRKFPIVNPLRLPKVLMELGCLGVCPNRVLCQWFPPADHHINR